MNEWFKKGIRRQFGWAFFTLILVLLTFGSANAAKFSAIYVFGDSLSSPGMDYPTNGPKWPEYLAPLVGLTGNDIHNYAVGGSSTLRICGTACGFQDVGLLDTYLSEHTEADPNALYVIWGGGSDLLHIAQYDPTWHITAAQNIKTTRDILIQKGATTIMIPNLPDMGMFPMYIGDVGQANPIVTGWVNDFNAELLSQVASPGTVLIPDLFALHHDIVWDTDNNRSKKYGIENYTDACHDPCWQDPTLPYLFIDAIHPTTVAQSIIADQYDIDLDAFCTARGEKGCDCFDGIDNDCDGKIDSSDPDCRNETCGCVPTGNPEDTCNGVDDDCDGFVDEDYVVMDHPTTCGDGICASTGYLVCAAGGVEQDTCVPGTPGIEGPIGDPTCNATLDNDCDGKIDTLDPDCRDIVCRDYTSQKTCNADPNCEWQGKGKNAHCVDKVICTPEPEICDDGADNDCDGDTDCADPDCAGTPPCDCTPSPEICNDGIDNDCDGKTDCSDKGDCRKDPAC